MLPGVSIRTSFLRVLIASEILHGSEPRCDDMVRYTEWASEGLAHHFAVESDELRLKIEPSRWSPFGVSFPFSCAPVEGLLNELMAAPPETGPHLCWIRARLAPRC